MSPTPYTYHKFFTISNRIEGIEDNGEVLNQIDLYEDLSVLDDERAMYAFHSHMNHLNSYCKPWILRTYDVFVGGRRCLEPKLIMSALSALFVVEPKTYKEIKDWHVLFEKIHPFGDGNGRTGRFLMLRQLVQNNVPIPQLFLSEKNFSANQQRYYRWFS